MSLESAITLAVNTDVMHFAERRHELQSKEQLDARLHAGAKNATGL